MSIKHISDESLQQVSRPKFRSHWDPISYDGEDYTDEVSITEPGRSESLQHLVERLTHKPNATMRDINDYIVATGQNFEDPTQMSAEEMDDRLDRVVSKGDNMDAAEALADASADFANAQASAVARTSADKRAKRVQTSEDNATAEAVSGDRLTAKENASD